MESFFLNSIQKRYCKKTSEDILNQIKVCKLCRKIPLPPYRSEKSLKDTYCKECYYYSNNDPAVILKTLEPDINLINQLIISCDSPGCDNQFTVHTLDQLITHVKHCEKERTSSSFINRKRRYKSSKRREIDVSLKVLKSEYSENYDKLLNEIKEIIIRQKKENEGKITKMENLIQEQYFHIKQLTQKQKALEENNKVMSSFSQLKNDLTALMNLINGNCKDIDNLSKDSKDYILCISNLRVTLNEMKYQIDNNVITRINLLEDNNKEINKKIESLTRERSEIKKELQFISDEVKTAKAEYKGIKSTLENNNYIIFKEFNRIKELFTKLDENNPILQSQLNNFNTLMSNLQERISKIQQETAEKISNLQVQLDNNVSQIKDLKMIKDRDNIILQPENISNNIGDSILSTNIIQNNHILNINTDKNTFFALNRNKNSSLASSSTSKTFSKIHRIAQHWEPIHSIAELSDGRVVTGCNDKKVRVWDILNNKCITDFNGHNDNINSLIQLKDGTVASGSSDKCIKIWDIKRNKCTNTLFGHISSVNAIIELSDGKIASCSNDKTIKIWNIKHNRCINTLFGHTSTVYSIVDLPEGLIASGSRDSTIKIWDVKNSQCITTLYGHSKSVFCLTKLSDGNIASGGSDYKIKVWDIKTSQCIKTLNGHTDWIYTIVQLTDGSIVSGSKDKSIKFWDMESGQCVNTLNAYSKSIYSLIQLTDGSIVGSSEDGFILKIV